MRRVWLREERSIGSYGPGAGKLYHADIPPGRSFGRPQSASPMPHSRGARRRALDAPQSQRLLALDASMESSTSPRHVSAQVEREVTVIDFMKRRGAPATNVGPWSNEQSEALLAGVAEHLARATGAAHALVVLAMDDALTRARVVASHPFPVFAEFETNTSAFRNVLGSETIVEIAGVRRQFPSDAVLGMLQADSFVGAAVLDDRGREVGWVAAIDGRSALNPELAREMARLAADAAREALTNMRQTAMLASLGTTPLVPTLAALEAARDGYWEWDFTQDVVHFSARWMELAGFPASARVAAASTWIQRVHPDDRPQFEQELALLSAGLRARFHNQHRLLHADGTYRWVDAQGVALNRQATGKRLLVGWLADVNGERELEAQLTSGSFRDCLTGLPNRGLFMDRVAQVLDRARRHPDHRYAVLKLDLDHFRRVNARFGDVGGDTLLAAVAQRLRAAMRPGDTIARTGCDKFAILLEDTREASDAIRVAERLRRIFDVPFPIANEDVFITASIGIAVSDTGYTRAAEVVRDADAAMCRAREVGDGTPALFDLAMHEVASARLKLETELRHAVERGEFEVFYQPIVRSDDCSAFAFEALLRWRHPERGLLTPAAFMDVLHDSGLIVPVGSWVIRDVCRQIASWRVATGTQFTVSVNLSARQLANPSLVQDVRAAIDDAGMDPSAIMFEITEETLIGERTAAAVVLSELRASGVRFLLDDFGTGYSSLSYLRELPVDAVKIDRSFLAGIHASPPQRAIVRAIVGLAADLGIQIVAEGVETAEQLSTVAELGCTLVQGFGVAPVMDAMSALGFIRDRSDA
jgi:diguanylate cyclase (GGDEF)-like protein/PAS domain S-box-containing protein